MRFKILFLFYFFVFAYIRFRTFHVYLNRIYYKLLGVTCLLNKQFFMTYKQHNYFTFESNSV